MRDIASPRNDPALHQEEGSAEVEAISDLNIDLGKLNPHDDSVPVEEASSNNNLPVVVVENSYWSDKNV